MRTLARHKREIAGAAAAAATAAAAAAAASGSTPKGGGGGGGGSSGGGSLSAGSRSGAGTGREGSSTGNPVDITPDGFVLPADRRVNNGSSEVIHCYWDTRCCENACSCARVYSYTLSLNLPRDGGLMAFSNLMEHRSTHLTAEQEDAVFVINFIASRRFACKLILPQKGHAEIRCMSCGGRSRR